MLRDPTKQYFCHIGLHCALATGAPFLQWSLNFGEFYTKSYIAYLAVATRSMIGHEQNRAHAALCNVWTEFAEVARVLDIEQPTWKFEPETRNVIQISVGCINGKPKRIAHLDMIGNLHLWALNVNLVRQLQASMLNSR